MFNHLEDGVKQVISAYKHTREIRSYVSDISGLKLGKSSVFLSGLIFPPAFNDAISTIDHEVGNRNEIWDSLKFGMVVIWVTDEIVELSMAVREEAEAEDMSTTDLTTSIVEQIKALRTGDTQVSADSLVDVSNQIVDATVTRFERTNFSISSEIIGIVRNLMPGVIQAMLLEEEVYQTGSFNEYLEVSTTTNSVHVLGAIVANLVGEDFASAMEPVRKLNEDFRILTDLMKVYKDLGGHKPNVVLKYMKEERVGIDTAIEHLKDRLNAELLEGILHTHLVTVVFLFSALKRMINIIDSPLGNIYKTVTRGKVDIPPANVELERIERDGYEVVSAIDSQDNFDGLVETIVQGMKSTSELTSYPLELVRQWLNNEQCFVAVELGSDKYIGSVIVKAIRNSETSEVDGYTVIGLNVDEDNRDICSDLFHYALMYANGKPVFVDSTNPIVHEFCERAGGARVDKYRRNNPLRNIWEQSYKNIMAEAMSLSTGRFALFLDFLLGYLRFSKFRAYVVNPKQK
ncbi:MAG: hypothetical protein JW870_09275 [Candidatus Delongbacteria bacterium]|nr:hypothetical protein [Candidatus Delongbacteria bacterium]